MSRCQRTTIEVVGYRIHNGSPLGVKVHYVILYTGKIAHALFVGVGNLTISSSAPAFEFITCRGGGKAVGREFLSHIVGKLLIRHRAGGGIAVFVEAHAVGDGSVLGIESHVAVSGKGNGSNCIGLLSIGVPTRKGRIAGRHRRIADIDAEGSMLCVAIGIVSITQQAVIRDRCIAADEAGLGGCHVGGGITDSHIGKHWILNVADGIHHFRHHVVAVNSPTVAKQCLEVTARG